MLEAMLLDIDGTLVASNDSHAGAWVDAYSEFGYDVPFERVQPLIGMGGDKLMASLTPGLSDAEGVGKEISQRRKEIFKERYAPKLKPTSGSRALVEALKDAGLGLVVASSSKREELEQLLKAAQVDDLVEETTTSDDAEETKPDPDIVAVALKKSGKQPDQVLMLGDTPYDVQAAGKIGVGVIAVRSGGHDDSDLNGALAIYDDPADLLAHLGESPIGERTRAPLEP